MTHYKKVGLGKSVSHMTDTVKEEQEKTTRDILNGIEQMDGGTGSGRINKKSKVIVTYKRQVDVEGYDRLRSEVIPHIKE